MDKEEEDSQFEWTPYAELRLLHSLYGLKPIGVCHHFMMVVVWEKFKRSMGVDVPLSVVKEKLKTFYNFEAAEEIIGEDDFPHRDFYLPRSEFPEVYEESPKKKTKL